MTEAAFMLTPLGLGDSRSLTRIGIGVLGRGFRLSQFQFGLAHFGGFGGIGAGGYVRFLEEVAPALVVVRRALSFLERLERGFNFLPATNDCDYSGRTIGSDVVQDDGVGRVGIVVCQKESACNRLAPVTACARFKFYDGGALSRHPAWGRARFWGELHSIAGDAHSGGIRSGTESPPGRAMCPSFPRKRTREGPVCRGPAQWLRIQPIRRRQRDFLVVFRWSWNPDSERRC
jgi:hypothetical protein